MGRSALIREVSGAAEAGVFRDLVLEYGEHLASHPAGPEHFCLAGFNEELAGLTEMYRAPGCMLLATVDGEPAGCVALREMAEPRGLELKRLWVRPAFRGLGLGRRLMDAAIAHAMVADAEAIYLDTVPAAMPEAVRLYAELGFEAVEPYSAKRMPGIGFFRLPLKEGVRSPGL
jgi:ribosomal protein S18 acetylase RimI-like enzyme